MYATLPLNILSTGLLKKGLLTHLHLLPVKNGFDRGGLSGSRQQLLQEDQWRQGTLRRQVSHIRR